MRQEFHDIVSGWTLIDGIDDLTERIERAAEWTKTNGPLLLDEEATVKLMIKTQIARGDTLRAARMVAAAVIAFPSETQENELREQATREIHASIERQRQQRARWPDNLNHAMSVLANLFPTMHGVPGTDPWDVHQLMGWMNTGAPTTGSWWAAMFLLGVWNPHTKWNKEGVKMRKDATGKFDLFVAMHGWDQQHIDAAMEWIANPFFP